MTQAEKAAAFAALHKPGDPLRLYNIWDAGSAAVVVDSGSPAVATGSWSVAAAQGYADGQAIPLDLLLTVASRIAATVGVPVSIDFEGAYGAAPAEVAANTARLIAAGAVGCNFEDQIIGGEGLHAAADQAARVRAMRGAADDAGVPLFVNARTDLFLKERDRAAHAGLVREAIDRAGAYAEAGASGFFVPALSDPELVASVASSTDLPVNVMAAAGAARISCGPFPYRTALKDLAARCAESAADT